jgi:putative transposase
MSGGRFGRRSGGVWSLGLHVVSCPKYRRRILGGRVAARRGELLEQIADGHGRQVVAKEVMADHVHLFVRVGPTDAPAEVVRAFEARTARVFALIFDAEGPDELLGQRAGDRFGGRHQRAGGGHGDDGVDFR